MYQMNQCSIENDAQSIPNEASSNRPTFPKQEYERTTRVAFMTPSKVQTTYTFQIVSNKQKKMHKMRKAKLLNSCAAVYPPFSFSLQQNFAPIQRHTQTIQEDPRFSTIQVDRIPKSFDIIPRGSLPGIKFTWNNL